MRVIEMTVRMTVAGDAGEVPNDAEMRLAMAQARSAVRLRLQREDFLSLDTVMSDLTVETREIQAPQAKAA